MLKVQNLAAGWGHGQILHGVSLTVAPRTITALVGANGAGKTTTLMAISNLVPDRTGAVYLGTKDLTPLPAQAVVAAGVVHCPEGRRVFAGMSVAENLDLGAYLRHDAAEVARDLDRAYARFPLLHERRHQLAGTLSGGEQQMLAIARALMARPQILLLDEPSLGLAPQVTERLFATIVELASEGQGILLVEQNAALALQVAHEALVLEHGHVTLRGKSQDLARDPRVQRAYLGGA